MLNNSWLWGLTNDKIFNFRSYNFEPPASGFYVVPGTLIPLSVIGVVTNVVTIATIFTSPKLKSTFNYFIASLAVSDLTSAVISILFLYRLTWGFDKWNWPNFLCDFFWSLDIWTSYVTSSHILLFSILRFVSIQYPASFKSITLAHARICVVTIWIVTGLVGAIPFGIWFEPMDRNTRDDINTKIWPSCALNIEWKEEFKIYTKILYTLFFYIPILLISILSITIGIKIHSKRNARSKMIGRSFRDGENKRQRKENQILLQLGLIVGSFLLGYITYSIYHLTTVDLESVDIHVAQFDYWFGFTEYLMLRISECLNPIFYNLASSVMRKETFRLLRKVGLKICFCYSPPKIKKEKRMRTDDVFI